MNALLSERIFFEMLMAIGNSQDLECMLKEALSTYLRKLNCRAGIVFMVRETGGRLMSCPVYRIPKIFKDDSAMHQIRDLTSCPEGAEWRERLPLIEEDVEAGMHRYYMDLPGFGILMLAKAGTPLDRGTMKTLGQVNEKLALACVSCVQRERLVQEVAERKKAEKRYREIFDNAAEGIFLTDLDGKMLDCNPAFAQMLGYASERDILGAKDDFCRRTWCDPEARGLFFERVEAEGHVSGCDVEFRKKSGRLIWISLSARSVRDEQGAVSHFESMCLDISERKAREKAEAESAAARMANEAKTRFLANMSHELRTPLNGVLGMLQLASSMPLSGEVAECIETASCSGKILLELINDILDLSKIEAGKIDVFPGPFAPGELIDQVVRMFRPQAEAKGVALEAMFGSHLPRFLVSDAGKIRQVLLNLVGNAVKFTEQGRIVLRVGLEYSSKSGSEAVLQIAVEDTGVGIACECLTDIFAPFMQGDISYRKRFQGTGLGLSIVRRLVDCLGGEVAIESEPGLGTTFRAEFPVRIEHERESAPVSAVAVQGAESCSPEADFRVLPLAILVAEDERVNQIIITKLLRNLGHDPVCVSNGMQAVETFRGECFDLILMDIQLPDMDGLETTARIRVEESSRGGYRTPIVALTAYAMSGDREKFLQADMDDYLAKPLDVEKLRVVLDRASKRKQALQPGS